MITEDYVSFETAKLLKEKGFDEKCSSVWRFTSNSPKGKGKWILYSYSMADEDSICNPTIQMAMKWLRETHNIDIIINVSSKDESDNKRKYTYAIVSKWFVGTDNVKRTYEESCEAGIGYCLEKLI